MCHITKFDTLMSFSFFLLFISEKLKKLFHFSFIFYSHLFFIIHFQKKKNYHPNIQLYSLAHVSGFKNGRLIESLHKYTNKSD